MLRKRSRSSLFGPRARALEMAGKRRTSAGATMPAPFDDELVASEEVLIAKWNEAQRRAATRTGWESTGTAIEDLEKSGARQGPDHAFEYEEDVEVEGC